MNHKLTHNTVHMHAETVHKSCQDRPNTNTCTVHTCTNTFTGCTFDPLSDLPDPFSLGVERGVETGVDTTTIEFDSATLSNTFYGTEKFCVKVSQNQDLLSELSDM